MCRPGDVTVPQSSIHHEASSLRDPRLDGLRGLAILLVMLFHTTQYPRVRGAGDAALTALPALGWCGVDLFFVLSGFLITRILLATRGSSSYAKSFYARRVLRIFPLYYAMLLFFFVIAPRVLALAELNAAWTGTRPTEQVWYWLHLSNLAAAQRGAFDHLSLAVAWSLAIEEQFYLVWPWVVRWLSERSLLRLCAATAAIALALRVACVAADTSWLVPYLLTPCRLDTLATGAAIALLARRQGGLAAHAALARRALLAAGAAFALLAIGLRVASRHRPQTYVVQTLAADAVMQTLGYSLLCLLFGTLLVAVATAPRGSRLARPFELVALRSLGKYSYALYLFHVPVAVALALVFPPTAFARHFALAQCAYWAVAIAATYALARLSWLVLESRCLALKNSAPYRLVAIRP
jgi:peptidoglycan/LPS O-acetylase OafA/YrhL